MRGIWREIFVRRSPPRLRLGCLNRQPIKLRHFFEWIDERGLPKRGEIGRRPLSRQNSSRQNVARRSPCARQRRKLLVREIWHDRKFRTQLGVRPPKPHLR